MTDKDSIIGLNNTYVEILRSQYEQDPASVSEEWRSFFGRAYKQVSTSEPLATEKNTAKTNSVNASQESKPTGITAVPLAGIAKKISENMQESLSLPTATSVRDIPVKVLEENRMIINAHLENEAYPRCSFTHLVAYALVKALKVHSNLNNGFLISDNTPTKIIREDINLGLAIDLPGKEGNRNLVVPNLKATQNMDFWTFFEAYNDIINRARHSHLKPEDFAGTTVTLTNPGGIGTVMSQPRLMFGQGTIIATGSIGYPAEYEAAAPETLRALGIGKIMTVTSTYDHRIIQGAESGQLLATLHQLLIGKHNFYNDIFLALEIPHQPYQLTSDQAIVFGQRADMAEMDRAMRVSQLIEAHRSRGYLIAGTDPLHLAPRSHPDLDLQSYGLSIWDLDREFDTMGVFPEKVAPLRETLQKLRNTYCRRVGAEYMHINNEEQRLFIQKKIEQDAEQFSNEKKKSILTKLIQSEEFEHFLHKRFLGHKRFSIEGGETVIAMLDEMLNSAASFDVTDLVIGMSHRGRLNILANIVGKPFEAIFAEFQDIDTKQFQGSGDVKYHLGAKGLHRWKGQAQNSSAIEEREIRIELSCNPSHLEAVDPVVQGIVRSKQDLCGDRTRNKVIPILLHGDAAFASQGVVYETIQFSNLHGYRTGGTIHVIVNNQIGYTTPPEKARSSDNCSDIGKALNIPVFRINGDNPEAALMACQIALEYRMRFHKDVILDVVCYRRHGHNEGDEPSFTQPVLYTAIQKHASTATLFGKYLVRRKCMTEEEVLAIRNKQREILENCLKFVEEKGRDGINSDYELFTSEPRQTEQEVDTKVPEATLHFITERTTHNPDVVQIHPRVKAQVLDKRRAMVFDKKTKIDFGQAEILAYGSLLLEGIPVRISGQDCGRGTFAHRHAVLYDLNSGKPYIPLNHLKKTLDEGEEEWHPSRFRIYDSPLSEEAILGFEYGYSVNHPTSLVIWEAQFGDFFNGAQVQVDQFIASSEVKWGQKSRVTLFLPHGYDGQGPEHSSARMERFLQLCAQDNMRVAVCSTPAQMFHLLRRQAKLPKKPLILFTHKSLLRAEHAGSELSELIEGQFSFVIDDVRKKPSERSERLVFCAGKIYWEADQLRAENPAFIKSARIVRVEQLYPFPAEEIKNLLHKHKAKEVVWLQEEPRNNGAFTYVEPLFRKLGASIRYIGRAAAASPATGSLKRHKIQQQTIIEAIFQPVEAQASDIEV